MKHPIAERMAAVLFKSCRDAIEGLPATEEAKAEVYVRTAELLQEHAEKMKEGDA